MSSSGRARSGIGGEGVGSVGRKDRGMDVGITVVPEADAVTPDGVVVDIVNGEWPEHRPDPAISAVAVSPPSVRVAAVLPAGQCCNRNDLPACRRVGKPGIHRRADVVRSEGSHSDVTVTSISTRVMYSSKRHYAGDRKPCDPHGTDTNTHSGQGRTRQQGCQKDNGNSNAPLRHGTLPRKASSRHLRDDDGQMTPGGTESSRNLLRRPPCCGGVSGGRPTIVTPAAAGVACPRCCPPCGPPAAPAGPPP